MDPSDPRPNDRPRAAEAWAFMEQCATAMAVLDCDGVVRAANPSLCEWLGSGTRNWRGEPIAMLDARPPQLIEAAARAGSEQRRIWLRDARLRTAIGDRAADVAFTPLDADVLVEVQSPGAETNSLRLSESLRGFAHEVKGPLAGVRGAAQLLRRHLEAPEQVELAELIMTEVDRVAALSDRLLRAGAKPRLARTNIHEALERTAALVATETPAPQIRRDYDPSLPAINADADRLQQALLNLARNAVEAGAQNLALRTRAEHSARIGERMQRLALRIDVGDDGRGVPAELAETLFEPLVSGRPDGTGLGLAIAREIAREHGGELTYTSRPGATVFTMFLPVSEEGAQG